MTLTFVTWLRSPETVLLVQLPEKLWTSRLFLVAKSTFLVFLLGVSNVYARDAYRVYARDGA